MSGCWLWRWQDLSAEGQLCRGEIIGHSRRDCGLRLVALGHQPFRLRIHGWLPARYWQRRALIDLTDRLASLLQTGLTLRESLTLLGAEYPRAGWRCLLAQIGADIERGGTLSRACAAWPQVFPPVWCAMFALGELTGRLDSCCAELAQSEARLWRLRQQVMRSLRYPLLVSMGAVGVLLLMLLMLLPAFARIYASAGVPLPPTAALLLRFAAHAGEQGLVYLAVALSLYGVWRRLCHYHPRWRHRLRATALWLPLAGPLLRHHALHQLFQTLSMTHRAGIALDRALAVAARAVWGTRAIVRPCCAAGRICAAARRCTKHWRHANIAVSGALPLAHSQRRAHRHAGRGFIAACAVTRQAGAGKGRTAGAAGRACAAAANGRHGVRTGGDSLFTPAAVRRSV